MKRTEEQSSAQLNLVFFHQVQELVIQGVFILNTLRVGNNTVQRANADARRLIVKANALGAKVRVDFINLIPHRNRLIRAFRFAHVAIDATFDNLQRHGANLHLVFSDCALLCINGILLQFSFTRGRITVDIATPCFVTHNQTKLQHLFINLFKRVRDTHHPARA